MAVLQEEDHYQVSVAVGERVLLPAVRGAPLDTLTVADGFSCREQIAQPTDGRALHTAQVLQLALRDGAGARDGFYPEAAYPDETAWQPSAAIPLLIGLGGGLLVGAALAAWVRRRQ